MKTAYSRGTPALIFVGVTLVFWIVARVAFGGLSLIWAAVIGAVLAGALVYWMARFVWRKRQWIAAHVAHLLLCAGVILMGIGWFEGMIIGAVCGGFLAVVGAILVAKK